MNGQGIYDLIDDNAANEGTIILSDSQISMISLCLNQLFTRVDYIFVICLMKFLSWQVGVLLRVCSSIYICIIASLLYYYSRSVIQLWALTWDLGLKKWLKYW